MPNRPDRRTTALLAVALAAIGLLLSAVASGAESHPPLAESHPSLPPQGIYEGCSPGGEGDACIERLERIGAAGFRYVLDYSAWYGSPTDVLRYADAAAALGLQLIWPLNSPAWRGLGGLASTYSAFAAAPSGAAAPFGAASSGAGSGHSAFVSAAVRLVAGHPATWGFYVGDELPSDEAGRVRRLSALVRAAAPGKPLLYVARPGADRLAPFAPFVDVAGADTYPVGSGDPPVHRTARSVRSAASPTGARTAMVLQAFSWSQYAQEPVPPRYPTARALRAMRDAAIQQAHPSLILWYSYQDILRSDHPTRRWRNLVGAAFAPAP
jgi:hypothetical protein